MKKRIVTKTALIVSIILLVVWCLLGATSTIAWFTDTSEAAVNSFWIGEVDLVVYHKVDTDNGNFVYEEVDTTTKIFGDEALYEPGYTQVVYLKIENQGSVAFDYRLSVNAANYVDGRTETGRVIHLPDYLKYGIVLGSTQADIDAVITSRGGAQAIATTNLNTFTDANDPYVDRNYGYDLEPGDAEYAAIVVYMPEGITNVANYRGSTAPEVDLGIAVKASQVGTISQIDD